MDSLTLEQRQKVNNLVRGKFYKYMPPNERYDKRIKIGKFMYLTDRDRNAELAFGYPTFTQISADSCEFSGGMGLYFFSVREIDHFSPIEAPPGAPADWEPSDEDLSAIACPPEPSTPENYNVNEPLSAENWAAREAARAGGVSWSRPGATGGGSAGPSGGAGASRKKWRSTRKNRRTKSRKVSRRH